MAEMMALLPCPFCGAPAAKNKNPGDRWVYYCPNGHTGYLRHKEWQARSHLAQPSQAVDVGAIREVIAECKRVPIGVVQAGALEAFIVQLAPKLTRAIGNAQAEGWNINKRGDVWDVTYTPPTKATPNAHE